MPSMLLTCVFMAVFLWMSCGQKTLSYFKKMVFVDKGRIFTSSVTLPSTAYYQPIKVGLYLFGDSFTTQYTGTITMTKYINYYCRGLS